MPASRRAFLKTTAIAGASVAFDGLTAFARPPEAHVELASAQLTAGSTSMRSVEYKRGGGNYPGAPSQNFGPELIPDTATYRNLAFLRPAYHSSSYDYNLTAQLVTDGIKDSHLPTWVGTSVNRLGMLPKTEREVFLDHFPTNVIPLRGTEPSVQVQIGGDTLPSVDRIAVFVVVPQWMTGDMLTFTASVSDDGRVWKKVG